MRVVLFSCLLLAFAFTSANALQSGTVVAFLNISSTNNI